MQPLNDEPISLSIHRAFVVQVAAAIPMEGGQLSGRVEHIVSGQAIHFVSTEGLVQFITQMLRQA